MIALLLFTAAAGIFAPRLSALVNVDTVLASVGGTLEWDPYLGYGTIVTAQNQLSFRPGLPWGSLNDGRRITLGDISRGPGGVLLFSESGAHAIEAALAAPIAASRPSATGPRIAAIILDPGHGGIDPGTMHDPFNGKSLYSHLMEKNIVLQIGLDVDALLKKRFPGMQIVMTRNKDEFVSLQKRTEIANSIKLKPDEAKIFVSIHANASFDRAANGFEVWYLPPTYQRDVLDPKSLKTSSRDLYPVLNAMREEEYTIQSSLLGEDILEGMTKTVGRREVDRGLKAQTWYVVRNSNMPAVLVEVGFVSNRTEAELLSSSAYLEKLAHGIYLGIEDFVNHFDTPSGSATH